MTTAAIIVAAGRGTRAGGDLPKQYAPLNGEAVITRTLRVFAEHDGVDVIQVVIHPDDEQAFAAASAGLSVLPPVHGGATRQASVLAGLRAVSEHAPDKVLIHDAARPFVDAATIDRVLGQLGNCDGAIPALAVADTLKKSRDGRIAETVDRSDLWAAQTPQGFDYPRIVAAHEEAARNDNMTLTDDAAVAEWFGLNVAIVEGSPRNRKLTTSADMHEAQNMLNPGSATNLLDIRMGHGFDVHAFEPGDHVILCGVSVPHTAKLKGHSDADVGMHALTDAIYGAMGDGDIGQHFPPSDPQWKGAKSDIFLKAAAEAVAARSGVISNVDVTMVCELPKIGPHSEAMRAALAAILGIEVDRVSVKATTSERLGFTGRGEGIAAYATATIRLPL